VALLSVFFFANLYLLLLVAICPEQDRPAHFVAVTSRVDDVAFQQNRDLLLVLALKSAFRTF
jgi:hypothetical protein